MYQGSDLEMTRADIELLAAKAELALMFYDKGEREKARAKVAEANHISSVIINERGLTPEDR